MTEKIYTRANLENEIELFKPQLIEMDQASFCGQRFNQNGAEEFGKELFDLYRVYVCLQDFPKAKAFKKINNNFYSFAPATCVKHGTAAYAA